MGIELAMQWCYNNKSNIKCYTNNIYQKEGGVHLSGFKRAITKTIIYFINKNKLNNNAIKNIIGEDVREGLTAILSIKFNNPKFSSQTKDKLISSNIRSIVEYIVIDKIKDYFINNNIICKKILSKVLENYKIRN